MNPLSHMLLPYAATFTIMFIEGTAVHSAAFLRQTAQEFQALHWSRLGFNVVGSALIFTGFLHYYRQRILTQPR